jgi:TonB-linked SusC/RagA family outer membrane protein
MYIFYQTKLKTEFTAFKRFMLIMRLTTIILITAIIQASASSYAQKVTLNERNIQLTDLFNKIRIQTGMDFLFSESTLKDYGRVSIKADQQEIDLVMKQILKGLPFEYRIENKAVIISRVEHSFVDKIISAFNAIDVSGQVTDEQGRPLAGANVTVKGNNLFTRTDQNGNFSFKQLAPDAVLVISYVGYTVKEIKVSENTLNIKLEPDETVLQEVQINKGYYSTTEKLNTGSSVQINAAQLERQPISNPIQALQGLVPGMQIKQTSGMAGSATTVLIRGRNSINSGLIPLYIIDGTPFNGVPVDQQVGSAATLLGGQPNGSTDPLSNINPNDIETITVLKDADATAIYGSRGANGVVLITTKRAGKGKPTLSVNYSRGLSEVVNQRGLLSSEDYLALRRTAFANDNRVATVALAPDLLLWDQSANTNYQDMLIGNTADQHDASASLSVGNELSSLLLSANYHNETSVLFGDAKYQKGGFNIRANQSSKDGRLKMDLGANLSLTTNKMPGSDFANAAITIPANYPLYDAAGKLYWITNFSNPIATSRQSISNKGNTLFLNGSISYKILDNLTIKTNLGYTNFSQDLVAKVPASTLSPLTSVPVSAGIYSSSTGKVYIAEPQLDYNQELWKGKLTATLGGSWQKSQNNQPYFISANTFASESLLDSYTNAANFTTVRSLNSEYRYISAFGLVNYNINDKYLINAVIRRDGSSRFGPGKKYGTFGSVGVAWNFLDEQFIKDLNVFSFGKLRSSYGITGNDQFENYSFMDTYTSATSSYGGNPGFYPTRVANPDFNWEVNKKFELGLELGFLEDRVRLTSAFYRNRSSNMVVRNTPLPAQTGFANYITNLDALVQNQGFEFDIRATPIKGAFTWDVSFNITIARNKLLSLPSSLLTLYANTYPVGSSLNSYLTLHSTGFKDGVAQFEDRNGDGFISTGLTNDSYVAGNRDPKYYGGLTSAFTYKGLRLDVLINYTKQLGLEQVGFPGTFGSQLDALYDSQFKPSTLTSSASYISYLNYGASDALISDASFIRLRNVSLSYAIPTKWLEAINTKRAQLFLRGQNLLTITKFKGLDPETQNGVLPPLKMFVAGIQVSF